MKRKRNQALNDALNRLAALYSNGELHLATDPAFLIHLVCNEIEAARDAFAREKQNRSTEGK